MKVYIVSEPDADMYCGSHIIGVFSTEEKAKEYMKIDEPYSPWFWDEYEIDSLCPKVKDE